MNQDGKILLQRRQGSKLWPGFLGLPAGHIDLGDNAYETAIKEAWEELGITFSETDISDTFVANRRNKSLPPYYDVYFVLSKYDGKIEIREPEKCTELVWCDLYNLPYDMISYQEETINRYLNGIKFSTIEANNEEVLDI